ncbi:hypothetical protein BDW75DRAFT_216826 [Aspergillus navahoensis]
MCGPFMYIEGYAWVEMEVSPPFMICTNHFYANLDRWQGLRDIYHSTASSGSMVILGGYLQKGNSDLRFREESASIPAEITGAAASVHCEST